MVICVLLCYWVVVFRLFLLCRLFFSGSQMFISSGLVIWYILWSCWKLVALKGLVSYLNRHNNYCYVSVCVCTSISVIYHPLFVRIEWSYFFRFQKTVTEYRQRIVFMKIIYTYIYIYMFTCIWTYTYINTCIHMKKHILFSIFFKNIYIFPCLGVIWTPMCASASKRARFSGRRERPWRDQADGGACRGKTLGPFYILVSAR